MSVADAKQELLKHLLDLQQEIPYGDVGLVPDAREMLKAIEALIDAKLEALHDRL